MMCYNPAPARGTTPAAFLWPGQGLPAETDHLQDSASLCAHKILFPVQAEQPTAGKGSHCPAASRLK